MGVCGILGVCGMLGVALMVFVLRETVHESLWIRLEEYIRRGFWGLNIGLAMMILFSLFPSGVLQVRDVLENGYWHARSLAYLSGELPRLLEWLRLPGDLVFIFLGALPILLAVGLGYLSLWSERPQAGTTRPAAVA
jgi:nitric oxide reductase subunit B